MRKARIAEAILSLFTSRERAGSTVGDWMEEAPAHGPFWFWPCVARMALSLLWRDFATDTSSLAILALRGLLVNLSLFFGMFIFIVASSVVIAVPSVVIGHFLGGSWVSAVSSGLSWVSRLADWFIVLAVQFQTGRWIARRARGKEVAACVAYLLVETLVIQIAGEVLFGGERGLRIIRDRPAGVPIPDITNADLIVTQLLAMAALFAGAVRARRHFTASGPRSTEHPAVHT